MTTVTQYQQCEVGLAIKGGQTLGENPGWGENICKKKNIRNSLDKKYFWPERAAFQSVGVRAADWQRRQWPLKTTLFSFFLARACGVPVGRRSGGRLATTLVATKNDIILFSFFSRRLLFSQKERSDQKPYLEKVDRSAQKPMVKNLGSNNLRFNSFQTPLAILD